MFLDASGPGTKACPEDERRLEQRAVPRFDERAFADSTLPSICISSFNVSGAAAAASTVTNASSEKALVSRR